MNKDWKSSITYCCHCNNQLWRSHLVSDKKSKDMNTNLKYHITLIPMTFHLSENICGQIVPVVTTVKKEQTTPKQNIYMYTRREDGN